MQPTFDFNEVKGTNKRAEKTKKRRLFPDFVDASPKMGHEFL